MSSGELGSAIKKARNDKKLTQEKLAELVDKTPQHIKQIESGRRNPSNALLFRIALALDLSLDSFISGTDDKNKEMVNKINLSLGNLNIDELEITYKTTEALRMSKDKDKEMDPDKSEEEEVDADDDDDNVDEDIDDDIKNECDKE